MAKILLVDDSPIDRRLFSGILEKEPDFSVISCSDGVSALASIEAEHPDIVLTDMQMPNMDGLELVTRIRELHTHVPVILITGRGSESLATKALRAGAAGYVPKSHSTDLLTETVRHVLELADARQTDERISKATTLVHYELALDNDDTLVPGVIELARQNLDRCGRCDSVTGLQVGVALEHALMNAIYHGNLDFRQYSGIEFDPGSRRHEARLLREKLPFKDRRVQLSIQITPAEARFVVRDEGSGFDVKEVSSIGLSHSLRGESGQGLFVMWAFMDKVVFNKSGNSVTLVKRYATPSEDKPAPTPRQAPAAEVLARLRAVEGGDEFAITRPRITIGRDPSCDVVINSSSVSHHHCLMFIHEGWWFVRDLKSKNGIKINGKAQSKHLLPPGAVLAVGPHEFRFDYEPHKLGAHGMTPPVDPF